ncbi:MAG TPA: hypothetical protein DCS05_09310 [Nitrospiraceae bacterium]|nr:hypothetical protein [Nitrospiraceae bacterium]
MRQPAEMPPDGVHLSRCLSVNGYVYLYWTDSETRKMRGALEHRYLWTLANGPIPVGHVIHHIDGNRANNNLHNLQCMPFVKHCGICRKTQDERRAKQATWHRNYVAANRDHVNTLARVARCNHTRSRSESEHLEELKKQREYRRTKRMRLSQPGNELALELERQKTRDRNARYRASRPRSRQNLQTSILRFA